MTFWHWRPDLWIEMKGAMGGIWITVLWPHIKHFRLDRRILALLIAYIGAPMLSVFALCFFLYERIWPQRLRARTDDK
jgi:hypothetical protein